MKSEIQMSFLFLILRQFLYRIGSYRLLEFHIGMNVEAKRSKEQNGFFVLEVNDEYLPVFHCWQTMKSLLFAGIYMLIWNFKFQCKGAVKFKISFFMVKQQEDII